MTKRIQSFLFFVISIFLCSLQLIRSSRYQPLELDVHEIQSHSHKAILYEYFSQGEITKQNKESLMALALKDIGALTSKAGMSLEEAPIAFSNVGNTIVDYLASPEHLISPRLLRQESECCCLSFLRCIFGPRCCSSPPRYAETLDQAIHRVDFTELSNLIGVHFVSRLKSDSTSAKTWNLALSQALKESLTSIKPSTPEEAIHFLIYNVVTGLQPCFVEMPLSLPTVVISHAPHETPTSLKLQEVMPLIPVLIISPDRIEPEKQPTLITTSVPSSITLPTVDTSNTTHESPTAPKLPEVIPTTTKLVTTSVSTSTTLTIEISHATHESPTSEASTSTQSTAIVPVQTVSQTRPRSNSADINDERL